METEEDHALIKALPPASDYMTYLTIVEYNLKPENLPILHRVLQDENLTTNIGWDLVHLLVPYLPDSEPCLLDIARMGNPREAILKVTESLRLIDYVELDDEEAVEDEDGDVRSRAESNTFPLKTAPTNSGSDDRSGNYQAVEVPPPPPLPVNQFIALLDMLAILQPRIKTKYPSRFLSTTLQAILASFSNAPAHREEMVESIVKTVKAITGIQRPMLPARRSSGVLRTMAAAASNEARPDPEAMGGGEKEAGEDAIQTKLLQSFVTHVIEEYMLNFAQYDDVPGMAWCSRVMERAHPERIVPESETFASRFANEERLHRRIDAMGQLGSLAQDLKISDAQLLDAAITIEKVPEPGGDEDDPPRSAEDVALSRLGSLLLYAGRQASSILYERRADVTSSFEIFPTHQELIKNCLSSHEMGTGQLGTEPEALIDSILALGLVCLERDSMGDLATDEQFTDYLQVIALLSSNCPNANLRGHAHYLTSTILRSQPDEEVRLAFIRDTLEHCPFENLKVSAVGWIKGEIIEANPPTPVAGHQHDHSASTTNGGGETSIFTKPLALDSLAPYLFPSLQADLLTAPIREAWLTFQTNLSFYLASLNFLYLLLHAKHLHGNLDIQDLWTNNDVAGSFLQPLRESKSRFLEAMGGGKELENEKDDEVMAEFSLLEETVGRVTKAVGNLNDA